MKKLLETSVNLLPYRVRGAIKYVPGLAATQRWLLRRYLEGRPFVHTINAGPAAGLRFEITLPQDKAVWAGTYEGAFTSAIVAHVTRGATCFDIGGYRGFMSGAMALAGGKVYVFEPAPDNLAALQKMCVLNPTLLITVIPLALSDENGETTFNLMPDRSMGKLVSSGFQRTARAISQIEVTVGTIDVLVAGGRIPVPDMMKVDVEGAELQVLLGAAGVLQKYKPHVFLEAHSEALERSCRELLLSAGYTVRRLEAELASADHTRHLVASA